MDSGIVSCDLYLKEDDNLLSYKTFNVHSLNLILKIGKITALVEETLTKSS